MTLEYASADFAVSQFAKSLGNQDLFAPFYSHASNWKNLYDERSGLIRPRFKDQRWFWPFDGISNLGYAEGSSTESTWIVPFDIKGLSKLMGGTDKPVNGSIPFLTSSTPITIHRTCGSETNPVSARRGSTTG